jgi:hypothetical protein
MGNQTINEVSLFIKYSSKEERIVRISPSLTSTELRERMNE